MSIVYQSLPIWIQQRLSDEDCTQLPNYLKDKSVIRYDKISLPTNPNEVWPKAEDLKLDESQFQALKCALTQEFVMIQGGPGMGKTFLASKIIQTLLQNHKYWEKYGPIIILTSSKNSLDQLLKSILPCTDSLVRIESPTQHEPLKSYSLIEKYKQLSKDSKVISSLIEKISEIESAIRNIKKYSSIIRCLSAPNIIVPLDCLFHISFMKNFKTDEELISWLFGKENIEISTENAHCYPVDDDKHIYENKECSYIDLLINAESINIDSFRPLHLLEFYSTKIMILKKEIEQLKEKKSLENLTVLEKNLEIVQQEKLCAENFFAQHPILNQLTTSLNNPRWNKYWQWVKSSYEFVSHKKLELEKVFQAKKLEINEIIYDAHSELLKKQKVIGLTLFDAYKILSSSLHIKGSIVLMKDSEKIDKNDPVWTLLRPSDYQQYILFWNEQCYSELSEFQTSIFNLKSYESKSDIKKICIRLVHQHRMRPEFNMLLASTFYEGLKSRVQCDSLKRFESYASIRGLKDNLFFIDKSLNKEEETQYLFGFVEYLLQEYQSSDITILCWTDIQSISLQIENLKNNATAGIKISSVENYQGKENKIIILFFNSESMCDEKSLFIALSRAQMGLYIMGNMHDFVLRNSFCKKVKQFLEKENCIGQFLQIRCRKHHEQFIEIRSAKDFKQYLLGGCSKILNASLPCGHEYTYTCLESDSVHEKYRMCTQQCNKKCPKGHPCPSKCFSKCPPCQVTVKKTLFCGHIAELLCSEEQNLWSFFEKYKCMQNCTRKCLNNHRCNKLCYEECEKCDVLVSKTRFCGHEIPNVKCSENVHNFSCKQPCNRLLICGHKCSLTCSEACGDRCHVIVEKMSPCGHKVQVHCYEEATPLKCDNKCQKTLACGHSCTKKCKEPCSSFVHFLVPCHLNKGNLDSFPKFIPVRGTDTMVRYGKSQKIFTLHQCITVMNEYQLKELSLEELRLEYYNLDPFRSFLKFIPVRGTDTMVKYGKSQTISTLHQCITVMNEYQLKELSLEELRLEYYNFFTKEQRVNKAKDYEVEFLRQQLATLNAENTELKEKVKDQQSTLTCVCTTCQERRVTRLFEVCKHACMCDECYRNYTRPMSGQEVVLGPNFIKCPVCRKFGSVVNIYIS